MLLEYLGTSGGRQSVCKSLAVKHPADFVCENPLKTERDQYVNPKKTSSVYCDLSLIAAVGSLGLRIDLVPDLLKTFVVVSLIGIGVGAIAVLIEAFSYFCRVQTDATDTRMLVDEGFNTSSQQDFFSSQELRRVTYAVSKEKSVFEEAQQNQQVLTQEVGNQILKVYEEVTHTKEIRRRKEPFNSSLAVFWYFKDISKAAEILADLAEKRWDALESQYREAYKDLVYTFILSENSDYDDEFSKKSNFFMGFLSTIHVYLVLLLVVIKYGTEPVSQLFSSVKRLKHFVLNAVEEESASYQEDLKEVLEDSATESDQKTRMTQEEFRDWLNTIWD